MRRKPKTFKHLLTRNLLISLTLFAFVALSAGMGQAVAATGHIGPDWHFLTGP